MFCSSFLWAPTFPPGHREADHSGIPLTVPGSGSPEILADSHTPWQRKVIHAVSNYWGEDSWRAACELATQLSEFLTHTKRALLVMQLPLRHPRFWKSPQQTQMDQAGLGWSHFFGALPEVNRYFLTASQERPQHASLAYEKVEFSALYKILPT